MLFQILILTPLISTVDAIIEHSENAKFNCSIDMSVNFLQFQWERQSVFGLMDA